MIRTYSAGARFFVRSSSRYSSTLSAAKSENGETRESRCRGCASADESSSSSLVRSAAILALSALIVARVPARSPSAGTRLGANVGTFCRA
eukprot:6173795-Pleurochrysis_carterae.AAC.1